MFDLDAILSRLCPAGVEFIVIGGLAAIVHGVDYTTQDVDLVYRRSPENIAALASSLTELRPMLRTPDGALPFLWDARTISNGFNFTLRTQAGDLDLLGEALGGGTYEALLQRAVETELFGHCVYVASLSDLVAMKRAAGRSKDMAVLFQLEALERLKSGTEGNGAPAPEEN